MSEPLNFGIIGTGGIAGDFAQALSQSKLCRVVNVVGSSPEKGQTFTKKFGLPAASGSLDQFLADKNVQAVYVATPHPSHEAQAIACIEAKKHVLCEKPMTIDAAGTERVIAAAKKHGVFLMEAFMYRCHPLMKELIGRLKGGVIGDIRHVRADFSFRVPRDPKGRLFDRALGGGGILDVGGYPVSFARLVAGLVEGKPFAEPTKVQAIGYRGPTGADETATALLSFASGFNATVSCAVHHEGGRVTQVFGEKGRIVIDDPWIPGGDRQSRQTGFSLHLDGKPPEFVPITTEVATYAIEAELVARTLPAVEAPWPAMSWADSLGNMRVLDAWQAAIP
ncbi:MAG TPA: Gfo/Idh/MocA family oxidoreductase [Polyangiaceae bacterium]